MELNESFEKYEFDELHHVSENPGIYCWYARVKIAKHDWVSMEGEEYAQFISDLLDRSRPAPMEASIKSSFGLNWNEMLSEQSYLNWKEKIYSLCVSTKDEEGQDEELEISGLLDSVADRELLSHVINEVEPILSAPLYVGRAKSLKTRLYDHKKKLDSIYESNPSNRSELFANGKEFYQRVFGAGFHVDELVVYTLDLKKLCERKGLNINLVDLRKHAALIEYVINRKVRPVLGRI